MDGPDTTATTVIDKSGTGNTGTRAGGLKLTTGKLGQAMTFDGVASSIAIGAGTGLSITGPISISLWAKFTTTTTGVPRMIYKRSGNYGAWLQENNGTAKVSFNFFDSAANLYSATSPNAMNDGQWHHYVGVYNGAQMKLYVDNVVANGSVTSATIFYETASSCIGCNGNEATNNVFIGSIDDVRVWNRGLSPAEVTELYKLGGVKISKTNTGSNTLKTGLVGWWTFDVKDLTAATTTDKSGVGSDGLRRSGVTVGTGKIGQAMKFDGVDDNVYISNTSSISFVSTTSFTLSAWVKTNTDNPDESLIRKYEGTPYYTITIGGDGGANKAYFGIRGAGGGEPLAKSTSIANDNNWHLITGVRDVAAGKIYLYFDGVRQATTADSSIGDFGTATGVLLGCHGTSVCSAFWLKGLMDDARIYNRALSPAEVAQLYSMGGGKINKSDVTRVDLKNGLVGWWTMDGKDTTSVTTTDKSGNADNGTRTGTTVGIGKIGQGLKFNGTTDVVLVTSNSVLDPATALTLSAWIKRERNNTREIYLGKGDGNLCSTTDYWMEIDATNHPNFYMGTGSGTCNQPVATDFSVTDTNWHLLTQVWDGSTMFIYLDGVRSTVTLATTGHLVATSNALGIGRLGGYAGFYLQGKMDDARIYNRALSQAEVVELYRMGK